MRPIRTRFRPRFQTPGRLPSAELLRLPGRVRRERLGNGLELCVVENRQAPLATSALFYRAGTRDEPAGHGGIAHFLEHMMFKGSALYGPGEIDRRTQALGGTNNAFTSHDLTAYYFNFAADRWTEALAIEADRMSALTLDPAQVASERQVILEEIGMYNDEPWDALELEVQARLFPDHPYGKAVLGTREELLATGAEELRAFHRAAYRPDNAVLVVAGEVGEEAREAVERTLGAIEPEGERLPRQPSSPPAAWPAGLVRVERRKGEVARLLLALPAPDAAHPDHPALRMLTSLLASGRASRFHRALVEEGQLCTWVSLDVPESLDAGQIHLAAEVVPGIEPARVEAEVMRLLAEAAAGEAPIEELERARQILLADWVFGHEKVHQQALSAGFALTLYDLDFLERHLAAALDSGLERLAEVAARYFTPERSGVLGWSLPRGA
ncbi:MAG TPA: pitrilysin family protein [Thermoanaerobaculia bacterium]|nr:pitrilysin family protein [Thermoanaerobaculia bacterium]